jgi:hypothetical protein
MNYINIIELLDQDPDGYWIAYDLRLTLGWADVSLPCIPWYLSESVSRSGHYGYSIDTRNSFCFDTVDSNSDYEYQSHTDRHTGSTHL